MADDIHNLVLSPFRDIVSKGNQALGNATLGSSEPMIKAAQSLVNNAERALKKIEPVCERQFKEHQSAFIDALKENDDITHYREQLNDTIWDLDDSLDVDTFNAEIYTKLQTLIRTAALKISDIVVRMKLERQQQEHPRLPETPITPISERPRTPSIIVSPSPVSSPMEAKAGPVQAWEEGEVTASVVVTRQETAQPVEESDSPTIKTNAPTILLEPVPPEPREDPWRGTSADNLTLQIRSPSTEDAVIQRRPRMSLGGQSDGEPVSPLTPDTERATPPFKHSPSSSRDNIVSPLDEDARNSFIIPAEALARVTVNQQPQTINSSLEHHDDELASPSSIYSDYNDETTSRIPTVPDTEGLIPVEHEHDNATTNSHSHPQSQVPTQNPSVLVTSTHNRAPPPPYKLKTDSPSNNTYDKDPTPPLLELISRTTITNVSFPAQYNGEWALGWHPITQKRGLFPLDCVSIQMPLSEDANFFRGMGGAANVPESGRFVGLARRRGRSASSGSGSGIFGNGSGNGNENTPGLSGLSAVARWSFGGSGSSSSSSGSGFTFGPATLKKDRDGTGNGSNEPPLHWLKFSKGEVITGICYPHPEHWCWAGYNSKNKWGIFPRAFMTPGTLIEEAPSNLLQLLHKEGANRTTSSPAGSSPIASNLFSRISSKGLPLPLGLKRLSSGSGAGSPTTTGRRDTGSSGGSGSGSGSGSSSFLDNNDWARRPSDGEPTPDSPSGSFFTHGSGGSAGNMNGITTRSPRPSLY
ncbi:hypothetical protein V8F20_002598 [Naviculisporaceae sp. PSN 640]